MMTGGAAPRVRHLNNLNLFRYIPSVSLNADALFYVLFAYKLLNNYIWHRDGDQRFSDGSILQRSLNLTELVVEC